VGLRQNPPLVPAFPTRRGWNNTSWDGIRGLHVASSRRLEAMSLQHACKNICDRPLSAALTAVFCCFGYDFIHKRNANARAGGYISRSSRIGVYVVTPTLPRGTTRLVHSCVSCPERHPIDTVAVQNSETRDQEKRPSKYASSLRF
jgi:hypothetical protein